MGGEGLGRGSSGVGRVRVWGLVSLGFCTWSGVCGPDFFFSFFRRAWNPRTRRMFLWGREGFFFRDQARNGVKIAFLSAFFSRQELSNDSLSVWLHS